MITLVLVLLGAAFIVYWLTGKLADAMRDYDYEYTFRGPNHSLKYAIEVTYKGERIYYDDYQATALFGYPKMVIQALSHKRRKGMK